MSSHPDDHAVPALKVPLAALMRWIYLALALLFLLLGIIGIFLPVLPTTPFILLAAWAAARSSPRLLNWLENHTAFGPMIIDWRRGGVVRRRSKWIATLVMSATGLYLVLGRQPWWAAALAIGIMTTVAIWLWRRPEHHADEAPAPEH
jgi:uncharacterized membrane protein YbaN (DUF454 family)